MLVPGPYLPPVGYVTDQQAQKIVDPSASRAQRVSDLQKRRAQQANNANHGNAVMDELKEWLNNAFSGDRDNERIEQWYQRVKEDNNAAILEARRYTEQREDTALLRYAEQLKKLGLNPAAYLGSGQAGASAGVANTMSNVSPALAGAQGTQLVGTGVSAAVSLLTTMMNNITSIYGKGISSVTSLLPLLLA